MRRKRREISAALVLAFVLAACGGSSDDDVVLPASSTTESAGAATESTVEPDTSGGESSTDPARTESGNEAGDSIDPETAEWRDRLLAVVTRFRAARAECLADAEACEENYDELIAPLVTGKTDEAMRAAVADRAPKGIRTRGIDPDLDFYRSFELYQREPTQATLTLCVVDRAVIYQVTGGSSEQILDDEVVTYLVQVQIVGPTPDQLLVESVISGESTELVGDYGQCEQYAT